MLKDTEIFDIEEMKKLAEEVEQAIFVPSRVDVPTVRKGQKEVCVLSGSESYDLWQNANPVKFGVTRQAAVQFLEEK